MSIYFGITAISFSFRTINIFPPNAGGECILAEQI